MVQEAIDIDKRWEMEWWRRTMLLMLVLVFLMLFFIPAFTKPLVLFGGSVLLLLNISYLFLSRKFALRKHLCCWWLGLLLDLSLVGFLIAVCGKISSPFTLLFPLAMVGAAPGCPKVRDFVIAGAIGHVSYAAAVFSFTGDLSFYLQPVFWIVGILNGLIFWITVNVVQALIKDQKMLLDLTEELANKNKQLEEMVITDGLTGLYNHKCFWDRLEQEFERAQRANRKLVVLMCDIDFFKIYNDRLGHLQGDKLLRQLSKLLHEGVRVGDDVCRYGGEEFGIILPDSGMREGLMIAERLRQEIAGHDFEGMEVMPSGRITISIGVACYPEDAGNVRELVNRADNALYAAKQRDKNRVQAYHSLLDDLKEDGAGDEDLFKTTEMMISIINAKDRYTKGHSERVAEYVKELGQELGMDENSLRALTYAAFLHDIGKIEIDRSVLNKPGPLNDAEREEIKKHTLYGVNILEPVLTSEKLLPAIKYHHERYDGRGYPEGIAGEKIPIEARMLALADSYDAMRSQRPYRNALNFETAIQELRNNAGNQFDPELAEKFIQVVRRLDSERSREVACTRENV